MKALYRCTFPGCAGTSVMVWAVWIDGNRGQEIAARCVEHKEVNALSTDTVCSVVDCGRIAKHMAIPRRGLALPLCVIHATAAADYMPGTPVTPGIPF